MTKNDDMTLDSVIAFIYNANAADLKTLNKVLREAWLHVNSETSLNFKLGMKVKFTSERDGRTRSGVIQKINRKTIRVDVETTISNDVLGPRITKWLVPPHMLKVA